MFELHTDVYEQLKMDQSTLVTTLKKEEIIKPDEVVISKDLSKMAQIKGDKIIIWDIEKSYKLGEITLSLLKYPIFSPDGTKLFLKEGDQTITMIDLNKRQMEKVHKRIKDNATITEEEKDKELTELKQILIKSNEKIHY